MSEEETEEYYNKLWLENKELIQENIERLDKKRFALQLMLADKDKEIERLEEDIESRKKEIDFWRIQFSNKEEIINKAIEYIEEKKYWFCDEHDLRCEDGKKLLEILKGENND